MPKHIVRLLLVLLGAGLTFFGLRAVFIDSSFGRFGHYRADSVSEVAALTPQYKDPSYCRMCHVKRHEEWSGGRHQMVTCEVCHGPARDHPAAGKLPLPEYSLSLCDVCHEAMPARPASHPQIVLTEHLGGAMGPAQCIACHNPHSPGIATDRQKPENESTTRQSLQEERAGKPAG